MTYVEVLARLPNDAIISSSFGCPGEDNYTEVFRDKAGNRYWIERKYHYETAGWTFQSLGLDRQPR